MLEGTVSPASQSYHGWEGTAGDVAVRCHERGLRLLALILVVQEVRPVCKPHSPLPRDLLLSRQMAMVQPDKNHVLKYFEGYWG